MSRILQFFKKIIEIYQALFFLETVMIEYIDVKVGCRLQINLTLEKFGDRSFKEMRYIRLRRDLLEIWQF
jgi:hypothetical protein